MFFLRSTPPTPTTINRSAFTEPAPPFLCDPRSPPAGRRLLSLPFPAPSTVMYQRMHPLSSVSNASSTTRPVSSDGIRLSTHGYPSSHVHHDRSSIYSQS